MNVLQDGTFVLCCLLPNEQFALHPRLWLFQMQTLVICFLRLQHSLQNSMYLLPREECFKAGSVVVNFHAAIGKTKSCSPGIGER